VLLAVNGIPLNDASRQFELMRLLNSESRFDVRLKREGAEMNLSVDAGELKR
jgi:type II secretory pathway component PulC